HWRAVRMAVDALPRVETRATQHRLAIAPAKQVHREDQRRASRTLRALDHLFRYRPILRPMVELKPDRGSSLGDRVLNGCRGDRGEHLQVVVRLGRTRDGNLAQWMECLLAPYRVDDNGRGITT